MKIELKILKKLYERSTAVSLPKAKKYPILFFFFFLIIQYLDLRSN